MKVFLDFEASSLSDHSYPIEVAWVFQDGRSESHLIAPAPSWTDWDPAAEAVHGIDRDVLTRDGTPHEVVARRMVDVLAGHELFASAPSWDGKWMSYLLRSSGIPRHSLRLRDTDDALRESCAEILRPALPPHRVDTLLPDIIASATAAKADQPAHRALADAMGEYETWARALRAARDLIADTA